jgi:hypothetical protein
MNYDIINCYASSGHGYQVKNKIEAVKQWSICRDPTESISVQLQVILKTRRLASRLGDDPGTIRIVPKRDCTLGLKLPYNYRELIAYFHLDL